MIVKHPYGVSPTLSCTIDGAAVAYDTIKEVEVFLEDNLHDLAVLHLTSIPARASQDYRNRGVQIIFDLGGNYVHEFVGYVIDVRPTSLTKDGIANGSPFQDAKLVCMGVSYEMRGSKSRVWGNTKLQDIASEMASTYGLSVDVPNDPLIFSPVLQDNESDWQFLVRLSKAYGYSVTLHGTHLHIFDPHKAAGRGSSYNKLRTAKNLPTTIAPAPGNIVSFTSSMMEDHPDGVYKDTVVTVHSEGGDVYDVTLRELRGLSSPARFQDRLAMSADTYEQAVRAINARSRETYDFCATVEVLGVPGCVPGGVVNVEEYGGEMDGLWYVQSVRHRLNSGIFVSELGLRRNINSELLNTVPVTTFRTPPSPRMLGGRWSASKRIVNVYS